MKTPAFRSMCTEKILKTELFDKRDSVSDRLFLKYKSKMTNNGCVLKFHRLSVDGTHLTHLKSGTFVLKFLQRSVEGALNTK